MATNGEERLLTLFADVHYYFMEPGPRPVQHRFDKECYVYLYQDAAQKRGRLEVANHAGTPEQDAFTGYLDNAKISQSHRHPTLVTVVVDGYGKASSHQQGAEHWRLPSTDPRDEGKYLFRLHTLEIYFWTVEDAHYFVHSAQQALQAEQFNVDMPPTSQHAGTMSPVVQNLENVAISDPAYQKPTQGRHSRAASTTAQVGVQPIPPPVQDAKKDLSPAAFTPLAYNPSAPPPPEEIKHREKTPPPPDADGSTGLAAAAYNDLHGQPHPTQQQYQPQPGMSNLPPPPTVSATGQRYSQSSVPPSATSQTSPPPSHRPSNASATYTPTGATSPAPSASGSQRYIPTGVDPSTYRQAQDVSKQPLDSPTAEILGGNFDGGRRQPVTHLQPQYADYLNSRPTSTSQSPPAGFVQSPPGANPQHQQHLQQHGQQHHGHHHHSSQPVAAVGGQPPPYNPQQHPQQQQPYWQANPYGTGDAALHNQVYIPGDGEASGYGMKPNKSSSAVSGGQQGQNRKWEQRAEKAEKGINKFLKKVEKKIG